MHGCRRRESSLPLMRSAHASDPTSQPMVRQVGWLAGNHSSSPDCRLLLRQMYGSWGPMRGSMDSSIHTEGDGEALATFEKHGMTQHHLCFALRVQNWSDLPRLVEDWRRWALRRQRSQRRLCLPGSGVESALCSVKFQSVAG